MSHDSPSLERLLENPRVWRGRNSATEQGLSTGYPLLDRHLPGGGWPQQALTEILIRHYGAGELRLLMPALSRLSAEEQHADYSEPGWIAWVAPPFQPYPPALQQWGIDLARVLIVRPKDDSEVLWSAEQALSSGTCAAVLLWPKSLTTRASRRLQLAAEQGGSWAVAFRPLMASTEPSAAALRIEIRPGSTGSCVRILKSRGGRPAMLHDVF